MLIIVPSSIVVALTSLEAGPGPALLLAWTTTSYCVNFFRLLRVKVSVSPVLSTLRQMNWWVPFTECSRWHTWYPRITPFWRCFWGAWKETHQTFHLQCEHHVYVIIKKIFFTFHVTLMLWEDIASRVTSCGGPSGSAHRDGEIRTEIKPSNTSLSY